MYVITNLSALLFECHFSHHKHSEDKTSQHHHHHHHHHPPPLPCDERIWAGQSVWDNYGGDDSIFMSVLTVASCYQITQKLNQTYPAPTTTTIIIIIPGAAKHYMGPQGPLKMNRHSLTKSRSCCYFPFSHSNF